MKYHSQNLNWERLIADGYSKSDLSETEGAHMKGNKKTVDQFSHFIQVFPFMETPCSEIPNQHITKFCSHSRLSL